MSESGSKASLPPLDNNSKHLIPRVQSLLQIINQKQTTKSNFTHSQQDKVQEYKKLQTSQNRNKTLDFQEDRGLKTTVEDYLLLKGEVTNLHLLNEQQQENNLTPISRQNDFSIFQNKIIHGALSLNNSPSRKQGKSFIFGAPVIRSEPPPDILPVNANEKKNNQKTQSERTFQSNIQLPPIHNFLIYSKNEIVNNPKRQYIPIVVPSTNEIISPFFLMQKKKFQRFNCDLKDRIFKVQDNYINKIKLKTLANRNSYDNY